MHLLWHQLAMHIEASHCLPYSIAWKTLTRAAVGSAGSCVFDQASNESTHELCASTQTELSSRTSAPVPAELQCCASAPTLQ